MPRAVTTPVIFSGRQVKSYCRKMLAQTDKFLDAADKAAQQGDAAPLAAFFGATNKWSGEQESTMFVLCTTFRRFAIHQPAQAKKLAKTIMENCTIGDRGPDGPYVHW